MNPTSKERNGYYDILEQTQKGNLDITDWLHWFLQCMSRAIAASAQLLQSILRKASFWKQHENTILNQRQVLLLNKLLDGFEGKLNSSKWAAIAKTSGDTALRDIQDLLNKKILQKEIGGGRSTSYVLLFNKKEQGA